MSFGPTQIDHGLLLGELLELDRRIFGDVPRLVDGSESLADRMADEDEHCRLDHDGDGVHGDAEIVGPARIDRIRKYDVQPGMVQGN